MTNKNSRNKKEFLEKEREISEAIIGGLIGVAFLFLGFQEAGLIASQNLNYILFILLSFLAVGILRIYGILLDNPKLKSLSKVVFKTITIPSSALLFPIMLIVQFLPLIAGSPPYWSLVLANAGVIGSVMLFVFTTSKIYDDVMKKDFKIREPLLKFILKKIKRRFRKHK